MELLHEIIRFLSFTFQTHLKLISGHLCMLLLFIKPVDLFLNPL